MKRAEGVEFSYYFGRHIYTAKRFYPLRALIQVFKFLLHNIKSGCAVALLLIQRFNLTYVNQE